MREASAREDEHNLKTILILFIILVICVVINILFHAAIIAGYLENGYHMEYNNETVPEEFADSFISYPWTCSVHPVYKTLDYEKANIIDMGKVIARAEEMGYELLYNGQTIDPSNYILTSDKQYAVISFKNQKVLITDD